MTTVKVGDYAEWRFERGDQWVIRGTFDYPCVPYEYFGVGRKGFSSGERQVKEEDEDDEVCHSFNVLASTNLTI